MKTAKLDVGQTKKIRVVAIDAAGNVDRSPAKIKFVVKVSDPL